MNRRNAIKNTALGLGAVTALGSCNTPKVITTTTSTTTANPSTPLGALKNNINHSVCRWCYSSIPLEAFCESAQEIGIKSIELTTPEEWKILKKYDLTCAIGTHSKASLTKGFNNPKYHGDLQATYRKLIDQAADSGINTVIVFSGNREENIDDKIGLENCAVGLDSLVKYAEKQNINIVMELLNSKIDHKGYQCDRTPWGAALVDKLGSSRFKLLYDIYHMQIMEGDIIATIRQYKDYIGHYHTGGVPGRNEINLNQELNYPAIMKAIVATDYKGYVAQEFIPTYEDKLAALREGIRICDV